MAITGKTSISAEYTVPATAATLGTDTEAVARTYTTSWAQGTGANQVDATFSESRTLAATSTTYDLKALATPRGNVALGHVRSITVAIVTSTDPNGLTLGNEGSANEWVSLFGAAGDKLKMLSLGKLAITAPDVTGYVVGAANKLLKVDAGAATITYEIIICGTTT